MNRGVSTKKWQDERVNQQKIAFKVWHHLCRTVQQLMEKQRIVDTLYFGTFARASALGQNGDNFVYCPGPKAALKLVENEDNVAEIS